MKIITKEEFIKMSPEKRKETLKQIDYRFFRYDKMSKRHHTSKASISYALRNIKSKGLLKNIASSLEKRSKKISNGNVKS